MKGEKNPAQAVAAVPVPEGKIFNLSLYGTGFRTDPGKVSFKGESGIFVLPGFYSFSGRKCSPSGMKVISASVPGDSVSCPDRPGVCTVSGSVPGSSTSYSRTLPR